MRFWFSIEINHVFRTLAKIWKKVNAVAICPTNLVFLYSKYSGFLKTNHDSSTELQSKYNKNLI